jgi:hypothetical protein
VASIIGVGVACAGCGGATPQPPGAAERCEDVRVAKEQPLIADMRRPKLEDAVLEVFTRTQRWKLRRARARLVPNYPINEVVGLPTAVWTSLCGVAFSLTDVQQRYLDAWCYGRKVGYRNVVSGLSGLRADADADMRDALDQDIGMIVAFSPPTDWIDTADVDDIAALDVVASLTWMFGREGTAVAATRHALEVDQVPSADRCMRAFRGVFFAQHVRADVEPFYDELVRTAAATDDAACQPLLSAAACHLALLERGSPGTIERACAGHAAARELPSVEVAYAAVVAGWPREEAPFATWEALLAADVDAMPVEGTRTLLGPLVDAAVEAAGCDRARLDRIAAHVRRSDLDREELLGVVTRATDRCPMLTTRCR